MSNVGDLNSRVTDAILRAEHRTREAVLAWREVAALEKEIALSEQDVELATIARRGVWLANQTVRILEVLDRYSETEKQEGGV